MARTFVSFCLWTISCLCQPLLLQAHDFQNGPFRDLEIEAGIATYANVSDHPLYLALQPIQCDLFQSERFGSTPATVFISSEIHNDLPPRPRFVNVAETTNSDTCPFETSASLNSPTSDASFGESLLRVWDFAVVAAIQSLPKLQSALENYRANTLARLHKPATIATAFLKHQIVPALLRTASRRMQHSHVSIARNVDVLNADELERECLECDFDDELASPIADQSIHLENAGDPYWQYYEDCDRWGVKFADPTNNRSTIDRKQNSDSAVASSINSHPQPFSHTGGMPEMWDQIRNIFSESKRTVAKVISKPRKQINVWIGLAEFYAVELERIDLALVNLEGNNTLSPSHHPIQRALVDGWGNLHHSLRRPGALFVAWIAAPIANFQCDVAGQIPVSQIRAALANSGRAISKISPLSFRTSKISVSPSIFSKISE